LCGRLGKDFELSDTLDVAKFLLHARGLSVIPVERPGKKPVAKWAAFQQTHPTDDNLLAWFGNGHPRNIGIVTGAVSGVVVVDCDSPEAIAWADANLPPTPMMTQTAKGQHRFYRHPGIQVHNKARLHTGDPAVALDVRGDGGYVVAPSSVHETGVVYERRGTWPPIKELPVFDPGWIEPEPEPTQSNSSRPGSRPPDDREVVLRRARAYLEATPPAIQGQGGDTHTFTVCCRLVRGFDLSDGDALDVLGDWNQRCVPPWSLIELLDKIEGARKYGEEPIGGRLGERSSIVPSADASVGDLSSTKTTTEATPAPTPTSFNLTDSGNAEYFAARYGADIKYDHLRARWLLFRDHRWQPDADAEIRRLAKAAMRERFTDAAAIDDPNERSRVAKWAISSESRARIDALLYLAQAEHPIADAGAGWDADPMLLGVLNGVVELQSGRLRPGRREDRVTMATAVPFDPAATCARFERFLVELFPDDPELIAFLQRAFGYSLTGLTFEQILLLLLGGGANGKGTLTQTFHRILGDYAYTMPFATVELHQRSSIPNDLAALVGRRFVDASETNDGTRLNESRVKALTGCDPITARFLHAEFFTFEPVAKFWLSVNHRPVVRDDSHAFWRRIRLIPFTQTFAINPTLADDLWAEAPGILAWAVRGCLEWRAHGLNPPPVVLEATGTYREESDVLAEFFTEAIELDPDAEVGARDLFEHYRRWAIHHGVAERDLLTVTAFGRKMGERFKSEKDRATGVKHYFGLTRKGSFA
jgi:P4 family phage/plasmid primase-like protien